MGFDPSFQIRFGSAGTPVRYTALHCAVEEIGGIAPIFTLTKTDLYWSYHGAYDFHRICTLTRWKNCLLKLIFEIGW